MAQLSDAFTEKPRNGNKFVTTNVGVSYPFDDLHQRQAPKPYITAALWDTGASHCLISNELARNLNLHPIDKIKVQHAGGVSYENVYLAIAHVTKRYYVEVELTDFKSIDNFEIIIGMDVISRGDFAITNEKGITTFSFRLPSCTTIDFTKSPTQ